MGKFTNTEYHNTVNNLVTSMKDILNNPYYKWNDKPPTHVTYYNLNKEASTLDEGSKLNYTDIGKDSPFWYNKISDFYLYGIENIQVSMANDDYGAESNSIEGEAIILPNTIIPYINDYFVINYTKELLLFRINDVTQDTLEDGSNLYKVSYKLESSQNEHIEDNIKNHFTMLINNVGTGFNTIIRDETYNFIKELDTLCVNLKRYYKALFYTNRVQTFIFKHLENRFYDSCLIEFLIRNGILSGDGDYIQITHQLNLKNTFPIDYDRSFFRCIEKKDKKNLYRYLYKGQGEYIDNRLSIFNTRVEPYFSMQYMENIPEIGTISCFKNELLMHIESGLLFEDENKFYNIIIKYFNDIDLTDSDIDTLNDIDYENNYTLYYAIPSIIYCLEQYVVKNIQK